jgi:hypothetical protein
MGNTLMRRVMESIPVMYKKIIRDNDLFNAIKVYCRFIEGFEFSFQKEKDIELLNLLLDYFVENRCVQSAVMKELSPYTQNIVDKVLLTYYGRNIHLCDYLNNKFSLTNYPRNSQEIEEENLRLRKKFGSVKKNLIHRFIFSLCTMYNGDKKMREKMGDDLYNKVNEYYAFLFEYDSLNEDRDVKLIDMFFKHFNNNHSGKIDFMIFNEMSEYGQYIVSEVLMNYLNMTFQIWKSLEENMMRESSNRGSVIIAVSDTIHSN